MAASSSPRQTLCRIIYEIRCSSGNLRSRGRHRLRQCELHRFTGARRSFGSSMRSQPARVWPFTCPISRPRCERSWMRMACSTSTGPGDYTPRPTWPSTPFSRARTRLGPQRRTPRCRSAPEADRGAAAIAHRESLLTELFITAVRTMQAPASITSARLVGDRRSSGGRQCLGSGTSRSGGRSPHGPGSFPGPRRVQVANRW